MEYIFESVTPDLSIVPSYASVSEHAIYAVAAIEETYTNIMEEIGINELAIVMEEGDADTKKKFDIKKLFESLKKIVKELWAKFTGFVVNCRNKILAFAAEKLSNIKKLEKYLNGAKVKKAIEESDDDKWKKYVDKAFTEVNVTKAQEIAKKIESAPKSVADLITKYSGSEDKIEDIDNVLFNAFSGPTGFLQNKANYEDAEKARKCIYNYITTANYIPKNAAGAKKYAGEHYDNFLDNIKKGVKGFDTGMASAYKSCKKTLDDAVKEGKKAKNAKEMKCLFKLAKECAKFSSLAVSAVESIILKELVLESSVVLKALMLAAKKKEKAEKSEVKNESYDFSSELSSLFNF